jgi:hypothetical protein
MIYSIFEPQRGLYTYYESPNGNVPINGDLPVPKLPKDAGKIGVAAIDAARPLPADARRIGEGWTARGVVAQRGTASMAGLGASAMSTDMLWPWVPPVGLAVASFIVLKDGKRSTASRAVTGILAGAGLAVVERLAGAWEAK